MSNEYTPTTGEVMTAVVTYRAIWGPGVQPPATRAVATAEETAQYVEEWNRWLAQVKAEAQVEALREAAKSRMAWRYVSGHWLNDRADRIAREAGIEAADAPDCGTHNLVQHRDMKPPWCNKCGRDASGQMQRKEQDDD